MQWIPTNRLHTYILDLVICFERLPPLRTTQSRTLLKAWVSVAFD